ncbi:MAG: 1-phosphofructokinase [Eubacteriaceae bacterium]|nr:1-phosphofructokinase [Eubacteriaceae bacterium]
MILTITLNPAVDHTLELEDFKKGEVNRAIRSYKKAGGKGLNVSKVIGFAGGKTIATGFLGGDTGKWIAGELHGMRIMNDFVYTDKETRTNTKIIDITTEEVTDINETGEEIDISYVNELKTILHTIISNGDIVVLSGSLPKGMSAEVYTEIIEFSKEKGARVVLDATRDALKLALKTAPFMIKPNIHELEEIFDTEFTTMDEIKNACYKFIESGVSVVLVSMGGDGALLVTKDGVHKIDGIKVRVKNTVGAGDSMVGSFIFKYYEENDMISAFKYAVATATVHVSLGTTEGKKDEIEKYCSEIRVYSV